MSGDDLHATPHVVQADPPHDSSSAVTAQLIERVRGDRRDGTPTEVLSSVTADLLDDDVADIDVAEEVLTQSLDEILVALIAMRDDGTHGSALMDDMAHLFDVQPSPGTVYPRLHDLESAGTLTRHDLVQTKQYSISDDDAAESQLERAAYQHLALGLFLHAALDTV
ncbi:PadR family transcriptional regulator [Salinibaculum rarum]|uniref:PadR family transcriptional regulator n=1 Tax=Salinibaculum rarum TaxID=3058903 RepID=UPI002660499A|nr:helix-turn-helix transcriptional regulator [Salinibaculum sp. KK48]